MSINNTDDTIDSRDIIARIEELRDERADLALAVADAGVAFQGSTTTGATASAFMWREKAKAALIEWDETNAEELHALEALQSDAEQYAPDWQHGATLIRASFFKEYAQELADDIGAIDADATWPCNCIDWDEAARQLKQDYTEVEFDGVTYYVR